VVDRVAPRSEGLRAGERTNPLSERLFQSAISAFDLYTVYLGDRLGLYKALTEGGPATSAE
jgi:hypothetical protein